MRARKDLDEKQWKSVDKMCEIHCTGEEIASVLDMDYDTLNRNCKEQKGMAISEYIKQHQNEGKMSLRRAQWKSAEGGNVTMQIWLGKQWLGQRDQQEVTISERTDETIKKMDEYFKSDKDKEGEDVD